MNEDVFAKLKVQLEQLEWPNVYLFKFIVPNNPESVARTVALFDEASEIEYHESKNAKFISVSAKEMMLSADSIMEIYEKAKDIPGIISL